MFFFKEPFTECYSKLLILHLIQPNKIAVINLYKLQLIFVYVLTIA